MKAIVYTKYGPPGVLQIRQMEKPVPGDDEIVVRVHAATVSIADVRVRSFTVPLSFWIPARLALGVVTPKKKVLGMDFAGVVDTVGRDVKGYQPGDPVFGLMGERFGCYAQYLCLSEGWDGVGLAVKPGHLSFEEAAAVPFGGLTALYFLREAAIQPGQKVLINGASGSVGTWAVQLAGYYGADITAVCSSEKIEMVKSLGADTIIDYGKEDFTKSGNIYDVIFDVAGTASFSGCLRSLTKNGTLLHDVAAPAVMLRMKWAAKTGSRKMVGGGPDATTEDLDFLADLIASGRIKPVIDRIFPMDEIVAAHTYVETGQKRGNVVITMDQPGRV